MGEVFDRNCICIVCAAAYLSLQDKKTKIFEKEDLIQQGGC